MMLTSTPLTPGMRVTASLILAAQDPQSMPDTVQSQAVSFVEAIIVFLSARKRAVVIIESGN
jgi:hypothetical protein